jgi:uncharacterized metal-binding protein YceD (DUF177 family)
MSHLHVNLNEMQTEGKDVEGELRQDIFELGKESSAPRATAPVRFSLHISLDQDLVVVEGNITTQFDLECSRCLERFPWAVDLDPYTSDEPREGRSILDLTELLREDILLALPSYPHCEESNVKPCSCPAAGRFAKENQFAPISEEGASEDRSRDIWGALDGITTKEDPSK